MSRVCELQLSSLRSTAIPCETPHLTKGPGAEGMNEGSAGTNPSQKREEGFQCLSPVYLIFSLIWFPPRKTVKITIMRMPHLSFTLRKIHRQRHKQITQHANNGSLSCPLAGLGTCLGNPAAVDCTLVECRMQGFFFWGGGVELAS